MNRFYDFYGSLYTKEFGHIAVDCFRNLLAFANFSGKLLEIGAGPGLHVPHLIKNFQGEVTLTDVSRYFINRLKKFEDIKVVYADCTQLPFKDNSFDCLIANLVMQSVSDKEAFVREMKRVLVNNGIAAISV